MTVTPARFFLVAAVVCFTIALLLATAVVHGSSMIAWELGGLLSLALSFLVP